MFLRLLELCVLSAVLSAVSGEDGEDATVSPEAHTLPSWYGGNGEAFSVDPDSQKLPRLRSPVGQDFLVDPNTFFNSSELPSDGSEESGFPDDPDHVVQMWPPAGNMTKTDNKHRMFDGPAIAPPPEDDGPQGETGVCPASCQTVPGRPGPQGLPGPAGGQGLPGVKGLTGSKGVKGIKGDPGRTGDPGMTGEKGDQGEQGVCECTDGRDGTDGQLGPKGDKGDKGATGLKGLMGSKGMKGAKGDLGRTGDPGMTGEKGDRGEQGMCECTDGRDGTDGQQGQKGDKGDQGATGAQGAQGTAGVQGSKGELGFRGPPGPCSPAVQSAFSARLNESFPRRDWPVAFHTVLSNQQRHFEASMGTYTAPVNGSYVFSFHLSVAGKPLKVGLFVNHQPVFKLTEVHIPTTTSHQVALHLRAGDRAWLQVKDEQTNGMYSSRESASTFSGFLLYPDSCEQYVPAAMVVMIFGRCASSPSVGPT
uniref:C1q domain-containing protein n=1 Tax=Salarias fasciatus TaxID=181472 RepID=A0A672G076_SALFA